MKLTEKQKKAIAYIAVGALFIGMFAGITIRIAQDKTPVFPVFAEEPAPEEVEEDLRSQIQAKYDAVIENETSNGIDVSMYSGIIIYERYTDALIGRGIKTFDAYWDYISNKAYSKYGECSEKDIEEFFILEIASEFREQIYIPMDCENVWEIE